MGTEESDERQEQRGERVVYTDGACSGNPGPGGWAWALMDRTHGAGADPHTTNQRMELQAVLEAVRALDGPLEIRSDSTYVVNCFRDKWYEGWLARGWKNSQKKPVANRDLWEPLIDAYLDRPGQIRFTWVKGHSGEPMNDFVDELAVQAGKAQRASGEAAIDGPSAGADVPWPAGSALLVTGAGTIDAGAVVAIEQRIRQVNDDEVVVSGLRRGAELVAAEQAAAHGRRLAVVLPFEDPAAQWPVEDRERFDAAVAAAVWTVVLDGDRSRPGAAVAARDDWLAGAVGGAVVVADHLTAQRLELAGVPVLEI